MLKKLLLACGAVSSLLYVGADLVAAFRYPGDHNFLTQAVSELTAVGAPTKGLVEPMFIAYDLLVLAFAIGLWTSVRDDRLRVTAAFIAVLGVVGLVAAPFAAMNPRGSGFAANDMLHLAITTVIVLCIFGAVTFSTAALGPRFFTYSMVTLLVLAVFGALAGVEGVKLATGEATPWLGAVERVHIGAYLLWMTVLSFSVWPRGRRHSSNRDGRSLRVRSSLS